jgi:N-acetyl-gamma-glutamyl-phosphate reductase
MTIKVAVIGARGYTGAELLPLLLHHPECEIVAVGSSSVAGQLLATHVDGMEDCALEFSDIRPEALHDFPADAYILALPNGRAGAYAETLNEQRPDSVIIDLSADFRFDDAWAYGQPERFGERIRGARRIANPGCYATGAQLALAPVVESLASIPAVFGVSGYSGAGKTPSRKNDLEVLEDNLLPYALTDPVHEKEVSRHLGREIRLLPHVAPFFRGITLTVAAELDEGQSAEDLLRRYGDFYNGSSLISVQRDIPEVADVRGRHVVLIGGFTVSEGDPERISLVCVLDNLLKGAATQAVQNLNLAFDLEDQLMGIET